MATKLALIASGIAPDRPSDAQLLDQAFSALHRGDGTQAAAVYRQVLHRDPAQPVALANLGALLCQSGNLLEGSQLLAAAVKEDPANADARRNLVNAYACLAEECMATGDHAGMVRFTRRILGLDRNFDNALNQLVHALHFSGERAQLSDFAPDLDPGRLGRKIFIACMPKSGSTWLSGALERLTGYPHLRLAFSFLQNEQEIHLPCLIENATRDTITQQHCRATASNVQILQAFGIAPVVLVRNIFDAIVSLADFWASGAVKNTFLRGDFSALDRHSQIDAAIDNMAAWYVQFYVSWVVAADNGRLPVLWLNYEDMMADKRAALDSVARFHGIEKSRSSIAGVIEALESSRGTTRFNKGIAGRGVQEMTDEQIARVRRLAKHYPLIDFTRIGLAGVGL